MKAWYQPTYDSNVTRISTTLYRVVTAIVSLTLITITFVQDSHATGTWTRQKSGTLAWLHALYFLDQNRGWVVGSGGSFLATTDGGANWKAMRAPTEDNIRDLYFADELNGWLVCDRSIYLLRGKDEQRSYLLNTEDGGQTWRRVNMNGDPDARLFRILFAGMGRGWVFGEGGMIFVTSDGGQSWSKRRA